MKLTIRAATDVGTIRDHNEDSHLILEGTECPPGIDSVCVVADGMGGHAAGEIASQLTVDGIAQFFTQDTLQPIPKGNAYGSFLSQLVGSVNKDVWEAGQDPAHRGMGTTCTLASIRKDNLFLAHVGDSRAYIFRNNELHQITSDHSWVEEAVSQGLLTKEDARVHPNRNVITRAIGLYESVSVDTSSLKLLNSDIVLLCSDGLNSMIEDSEIQRILQTTHIDQVCEALVEAANSAGGHDNTTVITTVIGQYKPGSIKHGADTDKTQRISRPSLLVKFWNKLFKSH